MAGVCAIAFSTTVTMNPMKARVYVSFKTTVLDPQGQTIRSALNGLGHKSVAGVRQGKFFDIEIAPGAARLDAEREMNQIAQDVLANPVIEDYRVEFLD
jgi:phosphoribosylformylglycinamidine synthase PurS subunit